MTIHAVDCFGNTQPIVLRLSQPGPFQSLAHMKAPQRHCVPVSFCPEGPIGLIKMQSATCLGYMKYDLPWAYPETPAAILTRLLRCETDAWFLMAFTPWRWLLRK
jgi:hypothetical protein